MGKYKQSFLGDIPTKSKYISSKAHWISIVKSAYYFLPNIR